MNASSFRRWIAFAAALAVVGTLGLWSWKHLAKTEAAIVAQPDVSTWPQAFVTRLKAADSDARAGSFTALLELSRLYHANGFHPEAVDCYMKLIALQPKNPRWPYLLSLVYEKSGRPDEAKQLERTASALEPGHIRELRSAWEKELVDDCYDIKRLTDAAASENAQGRTRKAEEILRRAIGYQPGNDVTHRRLGELLDQAGAFPDAEKELRRALELNPREPQNFRQLALTQAHAGDDEAAERTLREGATRAPTDAALRFEHGSLLSSLNRFDEAISELDEALKLNSDDAETHFALANALMKSGENSRAALELRRTLELQPKHGRALLALARLSVMEGDEAGARELYSRVIKQSGVPRDSQERLRELFEQRFDHSP